MEISSQNRHHLDDSESISQSEKVLYYSQAEFLIDLKQEYPMSFRRTLKKVARPILFFLLVSLGSFVFNKFYLSQFHDPTLNKVLYYSSLLIPFGAFLWIIFKFIYFELERLSYKYCVQNGIFYISRGSIRKLQGSFPLSRITEVYLHRGWGDLCWGLCSLHVSTPTSYSGQFAFIHGLLKKDAVQLQRKLEELIKSNDLHMGDFHNAMNTAMNDAMKNYDAAHQDTTNINTTNIKLPKK